MNHEHRSSRSSSVLAAASTEKMRERRSTDIVESNPRTSATPSTGFDVQRVYETFTAALRQPDNPKSPITTQDYIDGYRELLK
jgi:hypothetical protein